MRAPRFLRSTSRASTPWTVTLRTPEGLKAVSDAPETCDRDG